VRARIKAEEKEQGYARSDSVEAMKANQQRRRLLRCFLIGWRFQSQEVEQMYSIQEIGSLFFFIVIY